MIESLVVKCTVEETLFRTADRTVVRRQKMQWKLLTKKIWRFTVTKVEKFSAREKKKNVYVKAVD